MSVVDPDIKIHAPHPRGGALCMGPTTGQLVSMDGVNCGECVQTSARGDALRALAPEGGYTAEDF